MKAEDILIAYSGKGYYSRESLIEAMKAYAKDQIEKDRERVQKNVKHSPDFYTIEVTHNNTPIILD